MQEDFAWLLQLLCCITFKNARSCKVLALTHRHY